MTTRQNSNPFVLPGLGQSADLGQNPLMASMEMMRQAWQGLAGTGALGQSALAASMNPEDLDRRITELQVIENWLKMNLSMLSSTIQGLEVQRATIATVKAFMGTGAAAQAAAQGQASGAFGAAGRKAAEPAEAGRDEPAAAAGAGSAKSEGPAPAGGAAGGGSANPADLSSVQAATQGWWDMLQKQFDTLAAATAATMRASETAAPAASGGASAKPARKSTAAKGAARKRSGGAGKSGKAEPGA